jgi:hypothetical protein
MECEQAGDKVFEYLDKKFVGTDIPLLQAFEYINRAHKNLTTASKELSKIQKTVDVEDVAILIIEAQKLNFIAEKILVLITQHPNWANYIAVQEMRLTRMQPQIGYQYQYRVN